MSGPIELNVLQERTLRGRRGLLLLREAPADHLEHARGAVEADGGEVVPREDAYVAAQRGRVEVEDAAADGGGGGRRGGVVGEEEAVAAAAGGGVRGR